MDTKQQTDDPNKVLRAADWFRLMGISPSLGWRILHGGDGPRWFRISQRLIGIRLKDHNSWLEKRARKSA
jgi:predicted DNA-binding transcriptional regulator AlpA